MPASAWYALWQWIIHRSGLSASNKVVRVCPGRTMAVSLRGPMASPTANVGPRRPATREAIAVDQKPELVGSAR